MLVDHARATVGGTRAALRLDVGSRSRRPRPCGSARPSRSTPLMRVWAVNGTNVRVQLVRRRARAGRTSPWPAPRCCGLRASRRPARPAARRRPAPARSRPAPGGTPTAWRLPRVMVPVLSSSSTSTSPAASTARPDVAITFACIMRSMPAMPMADSRPPMVVGIRQTSSATSTVTRDRRALPGRLDAVDRERQQRDAVASRKMIVSAASRMVSAISLGVFWRLAPSTMRDHAVEEGLARVGGDRARRASRTARACRR